MENNNNNVSFEEIIKNCREIKTIADDILESIESTIKSDTLNSIDVNVGELQINTVIDHYLQAINLSYDLSEKYNNFKKEIEDIRFILINKRNGAIELKGRILSKDLNIDNQIHTTLITLSQCTIYKWREDDETQDNSQKSSILLSPPPSYIQIQPKPKLLTKQKIIEKQILGNGSFHLKKVNDKINYIQIKFDNSGGGGNDTVTGITNVNNQTFIITSQTPILIHSKGHYVIKSGDDYYGLIFPDNIPSVYIDVLEKNLSAISFLITLPTIEKEIDITTTTTTTTTTNNNNNNDNDLVTLKKYEGPLFDSEETKTTTTTVEKKQDVSFVVSSIKSASDGLDSGSQTIAAGILSASAMISLGLRGGGYYLKSSLNKHETPTTVSPYVVTTVEGVKGVTSYAKQGSTYIISSMASAVATVGGGIVNLIRENSENGKGGEEEETTKSQALNAATEFGKTSIKSIGSILGAFGDGISLIYDEATGATVDVINHKYGEHVAKVTDQTLSSGKDIFDTAMNIRGLGINVIKNGGKEIVNQNFMTTNKEESTTTKGEDEDVVSLEKQTDQEQLLLQLEDEHLEEQKQLLLSFEQQHKQLKQQEASNNNNNNGYKMENSILFQ